MTTEYATLLAWVPVLGVLLAVATLVIQGRRSRYAMGIELMIRLQNEFTKLDFRLLRETTVASIREGSDERAELEEFLDAESRLR